MLRPFTGGRLDAHYLAFFDCFNRRLYFEAHEVLEDLWLQDRHGPDGDFFKGLIQLAGAFVHVQKLRPRPAVALLDLARANLQKYPPFHWQLDLFAVLGLIASWRENITTQASRLADIPPGDFPELHLREPAP